MKCVPGLVGGVVDGSLATALPDDGRKMAKVPTIVLW